MVAHGLEPLCRRLVSGDRIPRLVSKFFGNSLLLSLIFLYVQRKGNRLSLNKFYSWRWWRHVCVKLYMVASCCGRLSLLFLAHKLLESLLEGFFLVCFHCYLALGVRRWRVCGNPGMSQRLQRCKSFFVIFLKKIVNQVFCFIRYWLPFFCYNKREKLVCLMIIAATYYRSGARNSYSPDLPRSQMVDNHTTAKKAPFRSSKHRFYTLLSIIFWTLEQHTSFPCHTARHSRRSSQSH